MGGLLLVLHRTIIVQCTIRLDTGIASSYLAFMLQRSMNR